MHLKYRPKKFNDVIGNEAIKKSLISKLKTNSVNHTMFVGEKGCGKSSLAYILASCWGAGDVIEIDCVHFSKVEEMRENIDQWNKSSLFSEKRVVILDEVHDLSPKAQRVFLKPLESESLKDKLLYIACTTEADKIKGTPFFDRFTDYRVNLFSQKESLELINRVSEKEGINLSKNKKFLLVDKCQGNPRRLLIGLSKIKDIDGLDSVKSLLETIDFEDDPEIFELFKCIISNISWSVIVDKLNKILKKSSPETVGIILRKFLVSRLTSQYLKGEEEGNKIYKAYNEMRQVGTSQALTREDLIIAAYKTFYLYRGE